MSEVHVVLCHPADVRNVGSVIRAAANFGLRSVRIVTEDRDHLSDEDMYWFSSGAVEKIPVQWFDDVPSAVADCHRVLGTSRRPSDPDSPPEWPAAGIAARLSPDERVAVVFGTERTGMTTAEKSRCDAIIRIHTNPRFASMNLSHAVVCLAYELARPDPDQIGPPAGPVETPRAPARARDGFFDHVTGVCADTGYPPGRTPDNFVRRFRRLMTRANPDAAELSMVAGVFTEMRRLWTMVYSAPAAVTESGQKISTGVADTERDHAEFEEQGVGSGKSPGGQMGDESNE